MSAWRYYEKGIATAALDASARSLAEQMMFHAIGCIVIVDAESRPVGIVTDRDLCCRVVARGANPGDVTASEIASKPLHVAQSDEPIEVVAARMRQAGVRRMPVVRGDAVVGLVTLDDLVMHLGRELEELGSTAKLAIDESRKRGRRARRRQHVEESIEELEATAVASGREAVAFVRREVDSLRERLLGPGTQ